MSSLIKRKPTEDIRNYFEYFTPSGASSSSSSVPAMDTMFSQYAALNSAARQANQARRDFLKANRTRGRKRYFSDGSSGYGAYRSGRGGYWGRKIGSWFGLGDLGDKIGDLASDAASAATGLPISAALDTLGKGHALMSYDGKGRYRRRYRRYGRFRRYRRYRRGYGAYEPGAVDQETPQVANPHGTDGAVVIQHKEYIGDVVAPNNGFNMLYSLPINPAQLATFPWLSQIAANFEQYRVEGIIFHFRSTSGALATTQALGEIVACVDYNSYDAAPANKQQMLNQIFSRSVCPSASCEIPVECAPGQTTGTGLFYTRSALSFQGDIRQSDIGKFYLACQGVSSGGAIGNVALGELWVSYQIALYKPQLVPAAISSSVYVYSMTEGSWLTTYAPINFVNGINGLGITKTATGVDLQFPPGANTQFRVTIYDYDLAVGRAFGAPGLSFGSGIGTGTGLVVPYTGAVANSFTAPAGGATATISYCCTVKVLAAANAVLSITNGGLMIGTGFGEPHCLCIRVDPCQYNVPT